MLSLLKYWFDSVFGEQFTWNVVCRQSDVSEIVSNDAILWSYQRTGYRTCGVSFSCVVFSVSTPAWRQMLWLQCGKATCYCTLSDMQDSS